MSVTATSFKLFFPEFASEDDGFIEMRLAESRRQVDDSWIAADVDLATLYLAAHYVTVTVQQRESQTGQVVSAERFGPISVSYSTPSAVVADYSDLTTTTYGSRFLELARHNFPGVAVV